MSLADKKSNDINFPNRDQPSPLPQQQEDQQLLTEEIPVHEDLRALGVTKFLKRGNLVHLSFKKGMRAVTFYIQNKNLAKTLLSFEKGPLTAILQFQKKIFHVFQPFTTK